MSTTPAPGSSGSQTITATEEAPVPCPPTTVVLKKPKPRGVKWDESTAIDNEHMGKKSSKVCCIYHKPRAYDESDSEDDCNHGHGGKNAYDRQPCSSKKDWRKVDHVYIFLYVPTTFVAATNCCFTRESFKFSNVVCHLQLYATLRVCIHTIQKAYYFWEIMNW